MCVKPDPVLNFDILSIRDLGGINFEVVELLHQGIIYVIYVIAGVIRCL